MTKEKSKRYVVMIGSEYRKQLRIEAAQNDMSIYALVEKIFNQYFNNK